MLRELQPAAPVKSVSPFGRYCQCIKYNCGCCVHFSVEELKLINATGDCHFDACTVRVDAICSVYMSQEYLLEHLVMDQNQKVKQLNTEG